MNTERTATATVAGAAARMSKHTALQVQIWHVSSVADELQDLINRARGEDIPEQGLKSQADANVMKSRTESALSEVLAGGAEELQEQCDRLRDQIRTLEDILF